MKKYVNFKLVKKKPKTAVYYVISKSSGKILGSVYWYGPWRQYVFQPQPETIWSRGCMREVLEFIQKIMQKRDINV